MRNTSLHLLLRLSAAPAILAAALVALPAFAQTPANPTDTPQKTTSEECIDAAGRNICDAATGKEIIVTGSRIPVSNYTSPSPLTIITKDEVTGAGFSTVTSALQGAAISQGSSQINNFYGGYITNGGTGANTISLRGLGPTRTLVLLNGHRLAPAGTEGGVGSVDANVLPSAIVDQIQVLKDGASSVYGSDAIAGVVNIITDNKLEGLALDMQTNVPEVGAGVETRFSASFGVHGDRWKLIGSFDYYRRREISIGDESWARCPIAGYLSGVGTALGSGDYIDPSTGKPKCYSLDNGGVTINTLGVPRGVKTVDEDGNPTSYYNNTTDRITGAAGSFNRLVPDTSVTGGPLPGFSGVSLDTRDTFDRRGLQLQDDLVTPAKVYTGFLSGTYDTGILGDAQAYFEVLGNRRESSANGYSQLSLDYAAGSPLIPANLRNGATNFDGSISYYLPAGSSEITGGLPTAVRSFIGYGQLESHQRVDFFRTSGGLRGNTGIGNWKYDVYGSYSWNSSSYSAQRFITSRVAQSLSVVQNGDGSFSCSDPSNGCVAAPPVNAASIGGDLSQAYRNFITQTVTGRTKYKEIDGQINLNGNLFTLPGGPVQSAFGLEYRHSSINDQPAPESVAGELYNYATATPTVGSDEVWEAYGEVKIPIATHVPFAYNLFVDGSGRYTHYRSYGGGWTYRASGEYEPIRGLGFRASYGTSYRAPALFEQFQGAASGFLSQQTDPCDNYAVATNPNIKANCLAIGLPNNFTQTNSVKVLTGGGAGGGLRAETSKNFTAGVVLQPVLPSKYGTFSASVDYFSIEVDNGVAQVGAEGILGLCYGAASFNPDAGYCKLVVRDPATNALTVYDSYVNLSTNKVRGIEVELRYELPLGGDTSVRFNADILDYLEQSNKLFPTDALIDSNGTITSPKWSANGDVTLRSGKWKLRYEVDYLSGDSDRTYHVAATSADGVYDPDTEAYLRENYLFKTPDYFLHNLSLQYDTGKFEFTIGARNLLDTHPPQISSGLYSLVGNAPLYSGYDYVGRTLFVNVTAKVF